MQILLLKAQIGLMNVAMDWSFDSFLVNLREKLKVWGSGAIMILGVVMILAAVFQIGKGFIMGARAQTSWGMAIACLVIGGMLLAGGWNIVGTISTGAGTSIKSLGDSTTAKPALNGDSAPYETPKPAAPAAP